MNAARGVTRRTFLKAGALGSAALAGGARAQSTDYPRGPIRIVVGLPVGGSADVVVRATAHQLEKVFKQPVIVENKPGGQFVIAMQALANAPADGHTILHIYNGFPAVQATQQLFDLEKQTTPVAMTYSTPLVMMVREDSPFRRFGDVLTYARANPGKLTYGVLGAAGLEHLKMAQIERAAGIKGLAVPYKGGPDMLRALIGGEVDIAPAAAIFPKLHAGRVRALMVLETARWPDLPDVQTLAEAGLNVPPISYWGGFVVRAGTSGEIVERLARELATATREPEALKQIQASGHTTRFSASPEDFRRVIRDDLSWMSEAAKLIPSPAK